MRLRILWRIMEIEGGGGGVIRRGHNSPYDTKAELLFVQNNSKFKNIAKTWLPPSMLSSSSIVHV